LQPHIIIFRYHLSETSLNVYKKDSVFLFALLLLSVFFSSSYRSQEDLIDPEPESSEAEDMLSSEGGFDGEFGNTWFPRSGFGDQPGGGLTGWPARGGYFSIHCSVAELNFLGVDLFKLTTDRKIRKRRRSGAPRCAN